MHITDLKCVCGHRGTVLRVRLKIRLHSVNLVSSVATTDAKAKSSLGRAIFHPFQLSLQEEVIYPLHLKTEQSLET